MSLTAITPVGGPNPPGITKVYVCLVADIDTIDTPSAANEIATITMQSTKKFVEWAIIREESMLDSKKEGAKDSAYYSHTLTARIKDMLNNNTVTAALDIPIVALAQDSKGNVFVLGDKTMFADLETHESGTGKHGSADRNGIAFSITAKGLLSTVPVFTGTLSSIIA
jgi:hypothetical protein